MFNCELVETKKIIVVGTGKAAEIFCSYCPLEVAYFVDNDSVKWGTTINGIQVKGLSSLLNEDPNQIFIFIASMYVDQISSQLNDMGFLKNYHYIDTRTFINPSQSILDACNEQDLNNLMSKLRIIVPDISNQEGRESKYFNAFFELKRRALQAFQCKLMLMVVSSIQSKEINVVDIGDSAGTHMIYLKNLCAELGVKVNTLSVNLDPGAIEKIKESGLNAVQCRAEELDATYMDSINLFTSFQMVEHLHNPALFFRRLAKKSNCCRMVITVPYLKMSRVGLHHIRSSSKELVYAEDVHIFELSPKDWELLLMHSGWKVSYSEVYYQYPQEESMHKKWLEAYWCTTDFEGFWGAILEKDTVTSDLYMDWEE